MQRVARDRPLACLAAILVVAVALRLALLPTTAHLTEVFTDEFTVKRHVIFIHERGLLDSFRDTNTSYVAYQYILWVLAAIYERLGGVFSTDAASLRALVKISPMIFDLALVGLAWAAARALAPAGRVAVAGVATATIVALHPVVVYDSAVWAQIDATVALAGLASIWAATSGRPAIAGAALAAGMLFKPQPVIFAPVLLVLIFKTSGSRGIVAGVTAAAATTIVPLLPWLIAGDGERLVDVYRTLFGGTKVPALTQNAWNLWWFVPFEHVPQSHDVAFGAGGIDVTYQRLSLALSGVAAAVAACYAWRRADLRGGLVAASYLAVAFYVLPTSTHERYMYPLVALLAPVVVVEAKYRVLYAALSATLFINMFLVAPPVASWSRRWDDDLFTHYIAGLNLAMLLAFTWLMADEARLLRLDGALGAMRRIRGRSA